MEEDKKKHLHDKDVTYLKVLFNDIISFTIGLFYLFYLSFLILITISIFVFGADAPKESAFEIIIGSIIITGLFLFGLKYRISAITEVLINGDKVEAEIINGLSHEFFVHLTFRYSISGKPIKKKLLLPNTKYPRELIQKKHLILSVQSHMLK